MTAALPVFMVLDPHYGDQVRELVRNAHVWLIRSPTNTESAERVWAETESQESHPVEGSLTTFKRYGTTNEEAAAAMVDTVEQHHDESAQEHPYNTLHIVGASPTPELVRMLREAGFKRVQGTDVGLTAEK